MATSIPRTVAKRPVINLTMVLEMEKEQKQKLRNKLNFPEIEEMIGGNSNRIPSI